MFTCADCPGKPCRSHQLEKLPARCPTRRLPQGDNLSLYDRLDLEMARHAALVERAGYGRHTRLEETMSFAHRMGFRQLGVAFCMGLSQEGKILVSILRENGFEVTAVGCKCGSLSKRAIGISDEEQVRPGQFEAMCNPAGQAEHLNRAGTQLNLLLGLCVGHDTIFLRHTRAPATVLGSKDRALAHNPMGALYLSDAYLKRVHTFIQDEFSEKESR